MFDVTPNLIINCFFQDFIDHRLKRDRNDSYLDHRFCHFCKTGVTLLIFKSSGISPAALAIGEIGELG